MIKKRHIFLTTTVFFLLNSSCVEEIDFITETFASALIIDATITNQSKYQEIFLSRTYQFEEDGPNPESNATVTVIGNGVDHTFKEAEAGRYVSTNAFAAVSNIDYQLRITSANGRVYSSTITQLTQNTQIDALYVERETNDDGVNGMSVYADSFDPTGNSQYYRYEFEETFKIIAPFWRNQDAVVLSGDPLCEVGLVLRPEEQEICFRTETSHEINLTNTTSLTEDRVARHLVRFARSDDYKISHRYSILARQFVHSREAYEYLETLSNFSNEGSLFSQIQPGFINGNIVSESNSSEKVIGFFEVASVDEKRIFFNYVDYYPNESLPPYINTCQVFTPDRFTEHPTKTEVCGPLIRIIENRILVFLEINGSSEIAPYRMVPRVCGDCTAIGDIEPPSFWIE